MNRRNDPILGKIKLADFLHSEPNIKRLLLILAISAVTIAILQPKIFLSKDYFISMSYLFPEFGILALGMMVCMISGGIDLSVVATANFVGIISSLLLINLVPEHSTPALQNLIFLMVFLIALTLGALCGALNGTLIAKVGIPPILATLGAGDVIMGLAIALTKGSSISGIPDVLQNTINYTVFGFIPVTLIAFIGSVLVISFMLNKKSYGFKLFMMGSNQKASMFSGVKNENVIYITYITSGILAAISGILMCGRFNSARADFGISYTMQAILICVLGGVNPNGGFGSVKGVTLAILILQILSSSFNMFPSISNFYRELIWGAMLIIVMAYNYISNTREQRKKIKI